MPEFADVGDNSRARGVANQTGRSPDENDHQGVGPLAKRLGSGRMTRRAYLRQCVGPCVCKNIVRAPSSQAWALCCKNSTRACASSIRPRRSHLVSVTSRSLVQAANVRRSIVDLRLVHLFSPPNPRIVAALEISTLSSSGQSLASPCGRYRCRKQGGWRSWWP